MTFQKKRPLYFNFLLLKADLFRETELREVNIQIGLPIPSIQSSIAKKIISALPSYAFARKDWKEIKSNKTQKRKLIYQKVLLPLPPPRRPSGNDPHVCLGARRNFRAREERKQKHFLIDRAASFLPIASLPARFSSFRGRVRCISAHNGCDGALSMVGKLIC